MELRAVDKVKHVAKLVGGSQSEQSEATAPSPRRLELVRDHAIEYVSSQLGLENSLLLIKILSGLEHAAQATDQPQIARLKRGDRYGSRRELRGVQGSTISGPPNTRWLLSICLRQRQWIGTLKLLCGHWHCPSACMSAWGLQGTQVRVETEHYDDPL